MMRIRRLAAVAMVSSLAVAFGVGSPAGATTAAPGTPEVFQGSATATALDLALNNQVVTVGQGHVSLNSDGQLNAAGSAVNSVLGKTQSSAPLSKDGVVVDGPNCNPKIPLVVAEIDNACTQAVSALSHGLGHAYNHDTVDGVALNLNSVLSTLPLGNTLTQTLQPVVNALGLQKTLSPVTDTVGNVLADVLKTPTASLTVGDSASDVVSSPSSVVSTATANGLTLKILPAPAALNGAVAPLATVTVGRALATATYDRHTGKAVASVDPAVVTVDLAATPITPAAHIPVAIGSTQTITLPAGLGSILIQVSSGNTFTRPDGTVGATANAVKVAVQLLNQPLINLAVAGAQATVAGAPAVPAVFAPSPAVLAAHPTQLPHTGGYPWMPLAGGLIFAGFLVTRRLMAGSHR